MLRKLHLGRFAPGVVLPTHVIGRERPSSTIQILVIHTPNLISTLNANCQRPELNSISSEQLDCSRSMFVLSPPALGFQLTTRKQ